MLGFINMNLHSNTRDLSGKKVTGPLYRHIDISCIDISIRLLINVWVTLLQQFDKMLQQNTALLNERVTFNKSIAPLFRRMKIKNGRHKTIVSQFGMTEKNRIERRDWDVENQK